MSAIEELRSTGYEVHLEGDDIAFRWTGPGQPDADRVRPLLDEVRQHKEEAVAQLRQCSETDALANKDIRDPFDPANHVPPGLILAVEDLDKPGHCVAWRVGALDVRGYGATEVEAVEDLERIEQGAQA